MTTLSADELTRKYVFTGDTTLDQLIDRWVDHGYRPTLRCLLDVHRRGYWLHPLQEISRRELFALADAYDARAAERGIDVVAYRSYW